MSKIRIIVEPVNDGTSVNWLKFEESDGIRWKTADYLNLTIDEKTTILTALKQTANAIENNIKDEINGLPRK
jgi:hypothetical protein